ncbi:hypothetical protein Barb6_03176 [Bacteroidales bacterium Barb6]|nr:hypothetical protein Barb6_03176 [Bacteroidales bacterium Barb6]
MAEDVADVAGVALGTVADKYLAWFNRYAAGGIIILYNGIHEERIALFRPVTAERFPCRQIIHRLVHGGYHGGSQRLRHVPDTHADNLPVRVRHLESVYLFRYVGEQVTAL